MKISRKNYEKYFVDYLEGLLDSADRQELFAFLEKNADLKKELDEVEAMGPLQPQLVEFESKGSLKRIDIKHELDHPETLQQELIAMIEGDLSLERKIRLQSYLLQNTHAVKEKKRFEQTILKPDASIVYPHKNRLKHQPKVIPLYQGIAAVAAVLILFLFVYNFYPGNKNNQDKIVSANPQINAEQFENIDTKGSPAINKKAEAPLMKRVISKTPQQQPLARVDLQPIKVRKVQIGNKMPVKKLELKSLSAESLIVSRESDKAHGEFLSFKMLLLKKIFGTHELKTHDNSTTWALADAGVAQFNKLSRKKLFLRKYENEKGEKDKIKVKFGKLEFEKTLASK